MADNRNPERVYDWVDETNSDKLTRKAKESPVVVIGLLGLVTACALGAYKFKNRGKMSTSVYLLQLRVIAQGAVVGSMTIGLAYQLLDEFVINRKKPAS